MDKREKYAIMKVDPLCEKEVNDMISIPALLQIPSAAADSLSPATGVQSKWWIGAILLVLAAVTLVLLMGGKKKGDGNNGE